jgi:hypothetical protein
MVIKLNDLIGLKPLAKLRVLKVVISKGFQKIDEDILTNWELTPFGLHQ